MKENKCRVFLGIPVPQYVYEELKKSLCGYEQYFSSGHWILPENLHITIHFFGDIEREKLETLWNEIKNKLDDHRHSFLITVEKIAPFPNKKSGLIAGYIKLNQKIKFLFSLMKDISIYSAINTQQTFIPHITLYRNKNDYPLKLPAIDVQHCQFNMTELTLYESVLVSDKRMYRPLFSKAYNRVS